MSQLIDRAMYLMGRDKEYPLDELLEINCAKLLYRVNGLLKVLKVNPSVTSGYRPGHYNKAAGGATQSSHISCEAVDLGDAHLQLGKTIANSMLLKDFDLYMEDPAATPGWCHLQTRPTRSGKRIFKP